MANRKVKWFIYTVLVALLPIFLRILLWGCSDAGFIEFLNPSDFVAFGLVLHISNINEVEHYQNDATWQTTQNGVSIIFIVVYAGLFIINLLSQKITALNQESIKYCSVVLSLVSFMISFAVFHRLSKEV